jgi:hypothetical protein
MSTREMSTNVLFWPKCGGHQGHWWTSLSARTWKNILFSMYKLNMFYM